MNPPKYNADNPAHRAWRERIERTIVAPRGCGGKVVEPVPCPSLPSDLIDDATEKVERAP